jgi:REP element-mobilizing transposase RayT
MNVEQEDSAKGLARSQGGASQGMRFVEGRGWHSRGYLPHFDRRYSIQSITIHLGDSLPQEKLKRLEEELKDLGQSERDLKRRQAIQAWLDAGYGSCILRDPRAAAIMERVLFHFDGVHYRLLEWVIMPNHVHVLIEVIGTMTLGDIVKGWKAVSAKRICEALAPLGARQPSGAVAPAAPLGARQPPGAVAPAAPRLNTAPKDWRAPRRATP